MAIDPRTRMPVAERRAQLLHLGVELFSQRTYDRVSVDQIAERAGISKGLLYHYYPGKRELYLACVRSAVEALLEACEPATEAPPERRLQASLDAFIDYVERDMASFRNLLRGGSDNHPEVERILAEMRQRLTSRLAGYLGIEAPDAAVHYSLLGYVGFASFTCLEWASSGGLPRTALRTLLSEQLRGALQTAARLTADPAIRDRLEGLQAFLRSD